MRASSEFQFETAPNPDENNLFQDLSKNDPGCIWKVVHSIVWLVVLLSLRAHLLLISL